MPKEISKLRHLYASLDLNDLKFLMWNAKREKDEYKIQAITYALDDKSLDSEHAKHLIEQRDMGVELTPTKLGVNIRANLDSIEDY